VDGCTVGFRVADNVSGIGDVGAIKARQLNGCTKDK